MSAKTFNALLRKLSIIYNSSIGFEITSPYARFGLAKSSNVKLPNGDIKTHNYWTEAGREFVYFILKQYNILPNQDNTFIVEEILSGSEIN